ncbi:uncharacterized protein LOC113340969 [Papaver somniferum]|uniref:uncharacterized protein LOC113340969 n=1 Tax=Papaver somniferum TaxID=3469 RepID=UPI000E6FDC6A|nr:uncharacterized protein LOC113340969 [Papaver somniferum]
MSLNPPPGFIKGVKGALAMNSPRTAGHFPSNHRLTTPAIDCNKSSATAAAGPLSAYRKCCARSPSRPHEVVFIVEVSETKTFFGATTNISVHGLELNNNEFSSAQIWIQNGPDEEMSIIGFGWMDDSHKQTGCFNVICSGFVQVHRGVSLGAALEPVSVYGKDAWYTPFKVYQDPKTGNWWLIVDEIVGYWPKEIFTHLANNASMDYLKTTYMEKMKYVNEEGQDVNLNSYGVQMKQDAAVDCYKILFAGNKGGNWEVTVAFGGPGGMCP